MLKPTENQTTLAAFVRSMRKEERFIVALPLKVFLNESDRNCKWTCTYEISRTGVRIASLPGLEEVGQIVWLQRSIYKARYKMVWIGKPETNQHEQVGLELLDADVFIWDDSLRAKLL